VDYRLALRIEHADRWETGQQGTVEFEASKQGMAQACNDIATLEWPMVQDFYGIKEEDDETEADPD
jgi:hypothetical protein